MPTYRRRSIRQTELIIQEVWYEPDGRMTIPGQNYVFASFGTVEELGKPFLGIL